MNETIVYSSITIGQEFVEKARGEGRTFTPMQLLKLAYIAHGWMLGITGSLLIGEFAEVWPYGPVYPLLYHRIKGYRNNGITADITAGLGDVELLPDREDIVQKTYDVYKDYSGPELSSLTHEAGSPWYESKKQGLVYIPNEYIKSHYEKRANSSPE